MHDIYIYMYTYIVIQLHVYSRCWSSLVITPVEFLVHSHHSEAQQAKATNPWESNRQIMLVTCNSHVPSGVIKHGWKMDHRNQ